MKKILIVDDEKDLVEMLEVRIGALGYEVFKAYDGQEGLEKARETKPDLIILDIMMPKMNGYEVCRFLKFDEEFKNIPILMLTARGQDQDKKVGDDVGADAYMTKPFDGNELVTKIKEMLGDGK